ncbi:unnamed protein product [Rhizophagus irregularis]|nr:unnamed protein product [Rhizophagus irregularis]
MSSQDDITCKKCGEIYTEINYKWCEPCQINDLKQNFTNWTSGNEKIDELIQEIQLKIKNFDDIIVEWIPYNQFNDIKEIDDDDYNIIYSAIWTDGPLKYNYDKIERKRIPNKKVALKYLVNSQNNIINEFLNEAKSYTIENDDHSNIITMYGISKNMDTEDYIIVLQNCYCVNCGKIYTDKRYKWCNPCQINNLKQNFSSWTSGDEKVDKLIQKIQLKIDKLDDTIFDWIPYNQFNSIKTIGMKLYSAIWMNGPLYYDYDKIEWKRNSNEKINLINFDNSLKITNNEFLTYKKNKQYFIEDYTIKLYGISQNPDTKNYILILQDCYCEYCGKIYTDIKYKWCNQCQINNLKQNFANWTSGNEKIDELIQEMQLKINKHNDVIIEWIPFNQFNDIKKICNDSVPLYSAIWTNGLLEYNCDKMEQERIPNKEVALKFLSNSQNNDIINELLNEIESYSVQFVKYDNIIKTYIDEKHIRNYVSNIYGISQSPNSKDYIMVLQDCYCENCNKMYEITRYKWCNPCLINNLKQNFVNWTSGNEIIDELIQELQLSITKHSDIIVEWIPYNHFNNIKEIVQGEFATLYSADWMNGLLDYEYYKWKRKPNIKVTLKYLYNSQDITEEYLYGQIKSYSIAINKEDSTYNNPRIYGISQNQNTKDYIVVLENGNHCEKCGEIYTLISIKWCESCQISNFIMDFKNWTSGNVIIDKFIQEMQLEFEIYYDNIMVEWIPYNQFNNIKKIGENDFAMLYSAIWMNGPLEYDKSDKKEWIRMPNKKVALKYLCNSQNINNEFLNKETKLYVKSNEYDITKIYGISQNPDTKNYVIVLQDGILCDKCIKIYNDISNKWCKICQISNLKQNFANWTSGNQQIDEFIQEMQLKINNYNNIVEWIPYNQFNDINKIGKNDSAALYSAIWNNNYDKMEQKSIYNKEVTLKYLCNSQNNDITNEFLNKIKSYFIEYDNIIKIYGISQNSTTKDYIIVLEIGKNCEICGEIYADLTYKWCKSCQINDLKNRFANWTSGNKIIDELIQKEQLKIKNHDDIIVEWIPYYRFGNIKKVNKSDTTLQYSAIWMNGPLKYNGIKWERIPNKKVTLKYLCSSQNITNEILNEVNSYFIKVSDLPLNQSTDYSSILHPTKDISPKIYGTSQNPITRDYFIVIKDLKNNFINWTSENKKIDELIQEMQLKIKNYDDIIVEWIQYDQFNNIRKIGKGCFSTVYSALWENGPLQYNTNYEGLERDHSIEVALKCLHDSQNISNGLLNEVKNYSINHNKILKIYGISQNPITKDYIIVLQLASEGFVNSRYIKKPWYRIEKLYILYKIIDCLEIIHNNQTVHRDLHIGNILILPSDQFSDDICIMDMGLCKEVDNISNTVYGVMTYVAPEILRGKPYTQAADIYSFGMIMYFVATRRQPFANCAHDGILALNICNGIRPEINEQEAPKCYIELMKKCWSSNLDDRPKAIEIKEEINKQIEEAIRNKKFRFLNIGSNQSTVHPKACYTSRLLNPFTKNLPK